MRLYLPAHRGRRYRRNVCAPVVRSPHRTLDKSATEHPRLPLAGIIEDASLAGRYAMLTIDQLYLAAMRSVPQPRGLRRPGRAHLDEDLATIVGQRPIE